MTDFLPDRHQGEMTLATDDQLGILNQGASRAGETGETIIAYADDREPGLRHGAVPLASALTAAAASALPPRRPASAI